MPIMSMPTETLTQLKNLIEAAIADTDTRKTELIAFKVIQKLDQDGALRDAAIAAYKAGGLTSLQQDEESIEGFLASAIAGWAEGD